MADLIDRNSAIDSIEKLLRQGDELYPLTETDRIMNHAFEIAASCVYNLPSVHPDARLKKIEDLVDGSIDHFDKDDAMDLLYQIKEVLKDGLY